MKIAIKNSLVPNSGQRVYVVQGENLEKFIFHEFQETNVILIEHSERHEMFNMNITPTKELTVFIPIL